VGVIVYYVEGKMGVGDAFLARHSCLKAKKTAALIWGCRFVWVVEFVVCLGVRDRLSLGAVATVRGHGYGADRSVLEAAGRRGVPEGGDLRRFDARKLRVGGDVGVRGAGGGAVTAGEESGEEASEAKGGYF
jgi:hypothetical protein